MWGSFQSYGLTMCRSGATFNFPLLFTPLPPGDLTSTYLMIWHAWLMCVEPSQTFWPIIALVNTPLSYKWEDLKCVIWVVLIFHRVRFKEDRSERISTLLDKIASLEATNKQSLFESSRVELLDARHELLCILDQNFLCLRDLIRRGFYEFGDKRGRWLSQALHPRTSNILQSSSPSSSKGNVHTTADILAEFSQYYSSLYSIHDFTIQNCLPWGEQTSIYPPDRAAKLKADLTAEEL